MIPFAAFTVAQGGVTPTACSFSGALGGSGAGPTVTGTQRTVTVPPGNSGAIQITNQAEVGAVAFEYNKGGAGWVSAEVDPTELTFSNGETIQFRMTGATTGEEASWDMYDVTMATTIVSTTLLVP